MRGIAIPPSLQKRSQIAYASAWIRSQGIKILGSRVYAGLQKTVNRQIFRLLPSLVTVHP